MTFFRENNRALNFGISTIIAGTSYWAFSSDISWLFQFIWDVVLL